MMARHYQQSVQFIGVSIILVLVQGLREPSILEHPKDMAVADSHTPVTLKCKADGDPRPTIEWYKDGRRMEPTSSRLLLPGGDLFFLFVSAKRREVGTWWCEARNQLGSARSRNASLQIMYLRKEFRAEPKSTTIQSGKNLLLQCHPPKGDPEPVVSWSKDGSQLRMIGRFTRSDYGGLRISDVRLSDRGRYVCLASNPVGRRRSAPANIKVLGKPRFLETPSDIQALARESVEFACRADGDPLPVITWRKEDGRIPATRAEIADDHSLRIRGLMASDSGIYTCTAGSLSASAKLSVQTSRESQLKVHPAEVHLPPGGSTRLTCKSDGDGGKANQHQHVDWLKDDQLINTITEEEEERNGHPHQSRNNQRNNNHHHHQQQPRFVQFSNGSLLISDTRPSDGGLFTCSTEFGGQSTPSKLVIMDSSSSKNSNANSANIHVHPDNQGKSKNDTFDTLLSEDELVLVLQRPWVIGLLTLILMLVTSSAVITYLLRRRGPRAEKVRALEDRLRLNIRAATNPRQAPQLICPSKMGMTSDLMAASEPSYSLARNAMWVDCSWLKGKDVNGGQRGSGARGKFDASASAKLLDTSGTASSSSTANGYSSSAAMNGPVDDEFFGGGEGGGGGEYEEVADCHSMITFGKRWQDDHNGGLIGGGPGGGVVPSASHYAATTLVFQPAASEPYASRVLRPSSRPSTLQHL